VVGVHRDNDGFDRLEVRDHGPGIPDHLRPRLFGQFAVGGPEGVGLGLWIVRQLAGIIASGDRSAELRHIDVPTLVIHGDRDRMVHPTGGSATARAIPGARLETIVGLGHDLPIGGWGRIIDLITDHTASVEFADHRGALSRTPNSRSTHE